MSWQVNKILEQELELKLKPKLVPEQVSISDILLQAHTYTSLFLNNIFFRQMNISIKKYFIVFFDLDFLFYSVHCMDINQNISLEKQEYQDTWTPLH